MIFKGMWIDFLFSFMTEITSLIQEIASWTFASLVVILTFMKNYVYKYNVHDQFKFHAIDYTGWHKKIINKNSSYSTTKDR